MFPANLALNEPLRVECVVRRVVARYGIGVTIVIPEEAARKRFEALLFVLSQGAGPATASQKVPPSDESPKPLVAAVGAGGPGS
jgi:hypothetical protein